MMSMSKSLWQPSGLATRPAVVILAVGSVCVYISCVFWRLFQAKTAINLVRMLSWF